MEKGERPSFISKSARPQKVWAIQWRRSRDVERLASASPPYAVGKAAHSCKDEPLIVPPLKRDRCDADLVNQMNPKFRVCIKTFYIR